MSFINRLLNRKKTFTVKITFKVNEAIVSMDAENVTAYSKLHARRITENIVKNNLKISYD